MSKSKTIILFTFIFVLFIITFFSLYKDVNLLGGLRIHYDKEQVEQNAEQLMRNLDISTNGFEITANLKSNSSLIRQVQQNLGIKKGNKLLRKYLPGFYWKVDWQKPTNTSIAIGNRNEKSKGINNKLTVVYNNEGNLLEFSRHIPDSTSLRTVSPLRAGKIVKEFISRFGTIQNLSPKNNTQKDTTLFNNYSFISGTNEKYDFKIERKVELPHRTDYRYTWTGKSAYINDKIEMNINVSGSVVSKFKLDYEVPPAYSIDDFQAYRTTTQIIFYVIIFLLLMISAYKKIKVSEIGFKLAFVFAIVVFISFGLYFFSLISDRFRWEMLIPLLLGPLLFGTAMFLTWAVSEALTREVWKEKFVSIDLISNGYFFHSKVGENLFNGLSAGFGLTIIWLFLLLVIQNFKGVWNVAYNSNLISFFNSYIPALSILNKNIYLSLFYLTIFFNFMVSGLHKRLNSLTFLLLITSIIWGMVNTTSIHPLILGIIVEVIIGLFLILVYYKFDVLTTLIAILSFDSLNTGLSLFTSGNITYIQSGYIFIGLILLSVIFSTIALFTEDKITEYESITPAFEKNISERQRLQRELEIARDVQMSFLPTKSPQFKNLQISSRCLPALEVGGDYYDFIKFDENKIGIIIGDVSGKGTQAAFYMTLAKGFLKAVAKLSDSPAEVLKKMNALFYDNVEQGTFYSMIYAIFDMDKMVLRLARAGHNPVIVKNSLNNKIEILNPMGIALGLEKGIIFNKTINEIEINLNPDDIFVFYTDGFPEAMNKSRDEFGEEKLAEIVTQSVTMNTEDLLEILFAETKKFIGKAKQHDDMTMVVVRVSG